jgi:REP element-mobilizing transposase RayT
MPAMPFDPDRHQRRSIRLRDWDYAANGAYFVTLVTHARAALFGDIVAGAMRLTAIGEIAQTCWQAIPDHFNQVELDEFVVMPNHVHGIVMILGDTSADVGATDSVAPTMRAGPARGSLGAIIGQFKSVVTKRIRQLPEYSATPIWQRNYHERIIRNDRELNAMRDYIANNPARWAEDVENLRRR